MTNHTMTSGPSAERWREIASYDSAYRIPDRGQVLGVERHAHCMTFHGPGNQARAGRGSSQLTAELTAGLGWPCFVGVPRFGRIQYAKFTGI